MSQNKGVYPDEKTLASMPIIGKKPSNEKEEKHLKEFSEFEFHNLEEPGSEMVFTYGNTKTSCTIPLKHGVKYKMPRHIARHVDSLSIPIYKWTPDGSGSLTKTLNGYKTRFQMKQSFN